MKIEELNRKSLATVLKSIPDDKRGGNYKKTLSELMETLTLRLQLVLKMRFGLEDGITHTLEEIGKVLGVTRERVLQIEAKGLMLLLRFSRSDKLKEFLETLS